MTERTGSPGGPGAGGAGRAAPSLGGLLARFGAAVLLGGVCLGYIWSTLNALSTESVGPARLALAGLAIVLGLCAATLMVRYLRRLVADDQVR